VKGKQGQTLSFIKQIVCDRSEKGEKTAIEIKDRKKACAKKWDPYNAPPLRRQSETLHSNSRNSKEKNSEIQG